MRPRFTESTAAAAISAGEPSPRTFFGDDITQQESKTTLFTSTTFCRPFSVSIPEIQSPNYPQHHDGRGDDSTTFNTAPTGTVPATTPPCSRR